MNYGYYMEPVMPGVVRLVTLTRPVEWIYITNERLFKSLNHA